MSANMILIFSSTDYIFICAYLNYSSFTEHGCFILGYSTTTLKFLKEFDNRKTRYTLKGKSGDDEFQFNEKMKTIKEKEGAYSQA